jgi:phage terminase large subunit GpA-like protein
MIRHGIVHQFKDLEGLLSADWHDHEGCKYRISAGLIDSGGTRQGWQKHSRTMEVYEWCSRNRVMIPHKGMHGRTGDLISFKTIATFPGTNKAIPGGLTRANLRVDQFKDELERLLAIEPDDSGALQFHCEIDEAFARHYTAERKDENGDWIHDKKNRNDYWDCTVYALALREMLKLRIPRKTENRPQQAKTETAPRQTPSLPGWYQNRR